MRDEDEPLLTADRPVLGPGDRSEMEERLLKERSRARESLETALQEEDTPQKTSAGDSSKVPSHLADAASHTDEAHRDFRVAERSTERFNQVDAALTRLRDRPEAFGVCQTCGEPIPMERLRLVPWTLHCARHADEDPGPTPGKRR